jgi:hypothetical protein
MARMTRGVAAIFGDVLRDPMKLQVFRLSGAYERKPGLLKDVVIDVAETLRSLLPSYSHAYRFSLPHVVVCDGP